MTELQHIMERWLEVAKKRFTMNNFSGGINNLKDARDISINEFAYLEGFLIDQDGALRPMFDEAATHNGLFTNTSIESITTVIRKSGGNNLAYLESDIDLFFQGSSEVGTYATTSNVAIDFIATSESGVGEGETTAPRPRGTN